MNQSTSTRALMAISLIALFMGSAMAQEAPTTGERMSALAQMCVDTEQARSQRHEAEPLYQRLGGYERIHELTQEIVRLHNQNDAIKHIFVEVDSEALAKHVADFVATGTGGTEAYTGRTLPESHANLKLTDADFLAAGDDIVKAMQSLGHGQEEIDEIVCILVSLKDQVVFAAE